MKNLTAKQAGPLFTAVGFMGTAAMQIRAGMEDKKIKDQAEKVERWAEEITKELEHNISDTTVRKLEKHGKEFAKLCYVNGLIDHELVQPVLVRLFVGWFALDHLSIKLGVNRRKNIVYLNTTAWTLLLLLENKFRPLEELATVIATKLVEEVL